MIFSMYGLTVFSAVTFLFLVILIFKSVYLIRQAQVMIIERFGRFDRIIGPGLHIVIPFIEQPRQVIWSFVVSEGNGKRYYTITNTLERIDLRESVYEFPKQNVITKDNV